MKNDYANLQKGNHAKCPLIKLHDYATLYDCPTCIKKMGDNIRVQVTLIAS